MRNILFLIFCCFFIMSPHPSYAISRVIDVEESIDFNQKWFRRNQSDENNIKFLINGLKSIATGRAILKKAEDKAREKGLDLLQVLEVGEGSLTDTTLTRRFLASHPGQVNYETKSKVFIDRHLKTLDALLDLAHELTHFIYREPFNPYDRRFTLKDFIKGTIEGKGGEVEAYLVECKVLFELVPASYNRSTNCLKVIDKKTNNLSFEMGVLEFYKIGTHISNFKNDLEHFSLNENDLPKISSQEAFFISSAWGFPYPVAAVKEYSNIMNRVCNNDKKRILLMQNKVVKLKEHESVNGDELSDAQNTYKEMFEDFKKRCDRFT